MSQHEENQRAAELHDKAAHVHSAASATSGMQDHLTGSEMSRQAHEHSQTGYQHAEEAESNTFHHADISACAHELWLARGCPQGSPDEDWFLAAKQLRARAT